ncbi:subtilisin-like serine-protease S [Syzygium oleosum]|uniref:subtilisin-like serine-protease S n=1 Tax=Syzygium oleosum TaxID=219896 RepID=UPI0024BB6666|nr:subtilisin-like serine-protease S [Syzygium oleosum]
MDSVISVFESQMNKVHTTHSWDFLGVNSLYQYNQQGTEASSDVIVGVIDSGIWPESESFRDKGLGLVPEKFKGQCILGENFTLSYCNRKIVGARFYFKGFEAENGPLESFNLPFFRSARDADGHGSHTASTIAGSVVPNASLFGIAQGTARGGAPGARLAIYKACWFGQCNDADILAAMDDAIDDGVDMLSLSLGPTPPQPIYFENSISIGAFHAFRRGIVILASAGNAFFPGTAVNVAPWILTVAASSIDRQFSSNIYLGNSKVLKGYSLNPLKMEASYGLIAGSEAAAKGVPAKNASFCKNNTLDPTLVKGRIVLCMVEVLLRDDRREKAFSVRDAGGVGIILVDPVGQDVGFQFAIPGAVIGQAEAKELQSYMAIEKYPTANIAPTVTAFNTEPAPAMTMFSSMGPNIITPDIIKPDITAPGAKILAAWSPLATESTSGRPVNYNILSGTSMSCPHTAAVAAILKSYYPSWSPAAIKSAIMTTATVMDNSRNPIRRHPNGTQALPFDYGSGHINPVAALNPGLIYDFNSDDVINFLCSIGASPAQLKNLTGDLISCKNPLTSSYDFNYPSIGVSNMKGSTSVHRTVTYYGQGPTVYTAVINYPQGVRVAVYPAQLRFTQAGQKMSFRIDFSPYKSSNGSFVFGSLTWSNGIHIVRSPIGLNVISM